MIREHVRYNFFLYKKMFQGPEGYIAQICEVHLQYGNSTTIWRFYTFFDLIPLYSNLFSLPCSEYQNNVVVFLSIDKNLYSYISHFYNRCCAPVKLYLSLLQ